MTSSAFSARLLAVTLALLLAGCAAPITRVATGRTVLKNRLVVQAEAGWNQFPSGPDDAAPVWTVDGVTVDALKFFVAIPDGGAIAPLPRGDKNAPPLVFRSSMQPQEIVTLYGALLTRGGSTFEVRRIEPADFMGGRGFRFEYAVVRKSDDVRLSGVAYGAVRGSELFLIDYSAPRLAFFPKHVAQAEAIARSARLLN